MNVAAGDTFHIDPTGGTNVHLWIVLVVFRPELEYVDHAIIVNVTTPKPGGFVDRTCVLRPTDADRHPFVSHDSFVFYGDARQVEVKELEKLNEACKRPACQPALLARLRLGAHQSKHTKRGLRASIPQK